MKRKKLQLSKVVIAALNHDEMFLVRGATLINHSCDCNNTESCSVYIACCPPPKLLYYTGDCS